MGNNELIEKVVKLVAEERRIGVEVLELLQQIESRKAYAELHFDSLFSFCTKKLGYTDAQAARRIQTMRAMTEHPELNEKIEEGKLSVTTVAQVQTHLRKQKESGVIQTSEEKMDLFFSAENKSSKEVETKLQELSGEDPVITLILKLNPEEKAAWDKIKNLTAHSTRGEDSKVLSLIMNEWLKKNEPTEKVKRADEKKMGIFKNHSAKNVAIRQNAERKSRYIPTEIKRAVWRRDHGQCTNCKSTFALQYDHIKPFAKDGEHSVENIRLRCRSCNLHAGIKVYGEDRMRRFAN